MGKRELLARALRHSGLDRLLSLTVSRWKGLLVFNYHRVGCPGNSCFDHALWSATQEQFEQQVRFLKRNFQIARIADLDDLIRRPHRPAVMITFDDGYRDNYELALPVLRQQAVPATFFITSGFLDERRLAWWDEIAWMVHSSQRTDLPPFEWHSTTSPLHDSAAREQSIQRLLRSFKSIPNCENEPFLQRLAELTGSGRCPASLASENWMTWEMVRELDRAGQDIGGHTVSHPVLARTDVTAQREEIVRSKARIETELGHEITAFSYPVGQPDSFTGETKRLLREAGYRWAFSFSGGFCSTAAADEFNLPRVAVSPHLSRALFQATARLPWLFA